MKTSKRQRLPQAKRLSQAETFAKARRHQLMLMKRYLARKSRTQMLQMLLMIEETTQQAATVARYAYVHSFGPELEQLYSSWVEAGYEGGLPWTWDPYTRRQVFTDELKRRLLKHLGKQP